MLSFKCTNCGGEFEVHTHGELYCPFCGSRFYFSDRDLREYDDFRDSLLAFARASNDSAAESGDILDCWKYSDRVTFGQRDGGDIDVTYTFRYDMDGVDVLVGRESVVFVFPRSLSGRADRMLDAVERLQYPSADIKGLRRCLPSLRARFDLAESKVLLALEKPENVYPLKAFSNLGSRHVAWIVSRMENICCLLEFNGMDHPSMDEGSLFINPRTHEAFLLGGWWDAEKTGSRKCLRCIREVAERITGEKIDDAPAEFREFIRSKPQATAYDDFAAWDAVIEQGFGGHRFTKFTKD